MTNLEFFHQRRAYERGLFERVFQAVPGDKLDWRPEPKARSAGELIGHLIGHEQDLVELLESGDIHHRMHVPFDDVPHALELFRRAHQAAETGLRSMDEQTWEKVGKFLVQGNVIMEAPRRDLGWLLLFDAIHHRGQLSTYLRPMGSRVPAMYGPSADENVMG
jgi:uncharacterized damage-inducible protein DinB